MGHKNLDQLCLKQADISVSDKGLKRRKTLHAIRKHFIDDKEEEEGTLYEAGMF